MTKPILIGAAGLVGTVLRYWLAGFVGRKYGETFPWGTVVVNLIGCFAAGAAFYLTQEKFVLSETLRSMILIGLLGGFTTFSAYGLQTFALLRDGQLALATLNLIVSNVLGILMVWIGYTSFRVF